MNRLPLEKRVQILSMLVEGASMRSVSRVVDVSINTVTKLLVDAGLACVDFHDRTVRNVKSERIQADEIWSFTDNPPLAGIRFAGIACRVFGVARCNPSHHNGGSDQVGWAFLAFWSLGHGLLPLSLG